MNAISRRWLAAAAALMASASLGAALLTLLLAAPARPAEAAISAAPNADVNFGVALSSNTNLAAPGQLVTFTVIVSNTGSSADDDALLTGTHSPNFFPGAWDCVDDDNSSCDDPPAGTGPLTTIMWLPANSWVTVTVTGTVLPSAAASLTYTATITPAGDNDITSENNTSTITIPITRVANLGVHQSVAFPLGQAVPGLGVTYTVVVSNAGPNDMPVARITSALNPPGTVPFAWVCSAGVGATCSEGTGNGPLNTTAALNVGSEIIYTLTGILDPSATGNLTHTVTVDPIDPPDDPVTTNNSHALGLPLVPHVALSLSKTDGLAQVVAGGPVVYTLVAANGGPSALAAGRLLDVLPAGLTDAAWTCQAATGPCAGGSGSALDATLSLLPQGSVTYTLSARVAPGAVGALVNTANFTAPVGTVGGPATASDTSDVIHRSFVPHVTLRSCPPAEARELEDNDSFGAANPYGCLGRPWHARHDDARDFVYLDLLDGAPVTISLGWPGPAKSAGVQLQVFREGATSAPLTYRLVAPYVIASFVPPATGRYYVYVYTDPAQVDQSEYTLTIEP